jgi:hypothetical protein
MPLTQNEGQVAIPSRGTVCYTLVVLNKASQGQTFPGILTQRVTLLLGSPEDFEVGRAHVVGAETRHGTRLQDAFNHLGGHSHPCTAVDRVRLIHAVFDTNEELISHMSARGPLLRAVIGAALCHHMSRSKGRLIKSRWLDRPRQKFLAYPAACCQNLPIDRIPMATPSVLPDKPYE